MKKSPALIAFLLPLFLLPVGCNTNGVNTRIQEKAEVFARLNPMQKEQIQHGGIEPGYTQDMVYMALGHPSKITTSANGRDTTWVYKNYSAPSASPQANFQWSQGVQSSSVRSTVRREYAGSGTAGSVPGQYQQGSLTDTKTAGPQVAMDIPDLPIGTFLVTFRRNRVIDLRFDE